MARSNSRSHLQVEERAAQKYFKPLRLGVPISNIHIKGDDKFPMLKPTDWVKFIDKYWFWDKLFGGVRELEVGKQMLSDFWSRFRKLHPEHELLTKAVSPMCNYIPIFIHGDEGTHYKRGGVMIVQIQSALGLGTTLNPAVNQDTFGNCQGYLVNQKGVTMSTRLLLAVLPKEVYTDDPEPLNDMFEEICKNLRDAWESGVELQDGSRMYLAVIGVKGDWPWLDPSPVSELLCEIFLIGI